MKHVASRFLAAVLALIPGVFSIVSDPDALGIGLGAVFLLGLYVAWTRIAGGIILIVIGALMLCFFFINLLSPEGIPGGVPGILTWIAFILFPIASGILFILAGRKKLQK
jgi:hypothetical protein